MIKEETFVEQARAEYGKRYKAGGIEKQEAVNFLLDNKLAKKMTDAFKYVDKWEEGTENYSQYNTLREAIRSGNSATVNAAWNELTKYGFDDDDIASYTRTSIIKDMVVSGEITAGKATELLRKYAPYKKDSDNINKPKEWLENKDD